MYTGGPGRPKRLLGLPGSNPGPAHRYVLRGALETVRRVGLRILAVERGPDIVVEIDGVLAAIEVETGSNLDSAKFERLLDKYCIVIIVCTTREACPTARRIARHADNMIIVTTLYRLPIVLREAPRLAACPSGIGP